MRTLIKYLGSDAIENAVTCINFKFDKVLFFARPFQIREEKINITDFLKENCGVKKVEFVPLGAREVKETQEYMEQFIKTSHENYIDLTGNAGIFTTAIHEIAYKYNIPMHIYDIWKDKCVNVDDDIPGSIFDVETQEVKVDIEAYIKMVGGCVRDRQHKENKDNIHEDLIEYKKLFTNDEWSSFSYYIQRCRVDNSLKINCDDLRTYNEGQGKYIRPERLYELIQKGVDKKLFKNFTYLGVAFSFEIKNVDIGQGILESGSVLEQIAYMKEMETDPKPTDCRIGVHLDWDGVILEGSEGDVLNEIDVLRLDKFIPTFISCKNTRRVKKESLYELESVARRFGGNYVRMKLYTTAPMSKTDINRAARIGIEVETI